MCPEYFAWLRWARTVCLTVPCSYHVPHTALDTTTTTAQGDGDQGEHEAQATARGRSVLIEQKNIALPVRPRYMDLVRARAGVGVHERGQRVVTAHLQTIQERERGHVLPTEPAGSAAIASPRLRL